MNITRLDKTIYYLNRLAIAMVIIALILVFFVVPTEATMGHVQRIFYFHVAAGWSGSVAFFVALMGGALYLWKRDKQWDTLALVSVELGLIFITINIISGSIWGKAAWNTWWIWSPRLTSITVLWLVYAAYFMLRGAIDNPERRARFSAVYVILGFATVIITFYSIRLLRDIHPALEGSGTDAQGEQILTGMMTFTMVYSFITFSVLYAALLLDRMRLEYLSDEVKQLKVRVMSQLRG